jgi:hypothetical protein
MLAAVPPEVSHALDPLVQVNDFQLPELALLVSFLEEERRE